MKIAKKILWMLLSLLGFGWLGLQIRPRPFAPYPQQTAPLETVPLPAGLPAPVDRYFRQLYGAEVPLITSAVVSGRATIRPFGITLPARFRFTHDAGQGYRHYIEATFWGLPFLKVNERYVDGHALLQIPVIGTAEGHKTDQAANQGLWAESASYLPAILVTDPQVRWQAIDQDTALLIVPFEDEEQQFVARFHPQTGGLVMLETMRYRDEAGEKILWLATTVPGQTVTAGGAALEATGAATWLDQGRPWAIFTVEEIVYNVDVQEYIRAEGP